MRPLEADPPLAWRELGSDLPAGTCHRLQSTDWVAEMVTSFPFAGDLPSVPVFDRTLPVKQMHVLETLDLLVLRADKGGTPPGGALGGRKAGDPLWPTPKVTEV